HPAPPRARRTPRAEARCGSCRRSRLTAELAQRRRRHPLAARNGREAVPRPGDRPGADEYAKLDDAVRVLAEVATGRLPGVVAAAVHRHHHDDDDGEDDAAEPHDEGAVAHGSRPCVKAYPRHEYGSRAASYMPESIAPGKPAISRSR